MIGVCLKYEQKNYGSKLQALATVKYLEKIGIEYEILRYKKKTLGFILKSLPRFFNFIFLNDRYYELQKKIEFAKHPNIKKQVMVRNKVFDNYDIIFSDHLSEFYDSYRGLKKTCGKKYDGVLTCSDQLWSPSAMGSGFYNLMFAPENMLKVSWASSFGVSKIPWYQKKRTKKYLSRIEHISMRENRGSEIVKELTGRDVPVLMDPVFVFDKNEWNELIPLEKSEYGEYIFCYFLGECPEHRTAVKKLSEKTGLKIVTLRHLDSFVDEDELFGDYAPYDVAPEKFLNLLRNAKYVCTDSFHGTAFSVIFEKQFVVFDRYKQNAANSKNSRIDSLCENLDLSTRRYSESKKIYDIFKKPIDYININTKLSKYRELTGVYLHNAFNEQED